MWILLVLSFIDNMFSFISSLIEHLYEPFYEHLRDSCYDRLYEHLHDFIYDHPCEHIVISCLPHWRSYHASSLRCSATHRGAVRKGVRTGLRKGVRKCVH